jgi:hypothetical protein
MTASPSSSPSGENVSENRAESADWEKVGRDLLTEQAQSAELAVQEAISGIVTKAKTGEELQRNDYAELEIARHQLDDLLGHVDELTEPFVYERQEDDE